MNHRSRGGSVNLSHIFDVVVERTVNLIAKPPPFTVLSGSFSRQLSHNVLSTRFPRLVGMAYRTLASRLVFSASTGLFLDGHNGGTTMAGYRNIPYHKALGEDVSSSQPVAATQSYLTVPSLAVKEGFGRRPSLKLFALAAWRKISAFSDLGAAAEKPGPDSRPSYHRNASMGWGPRRNNSHWSCFWIHLPGSSYQSPFSVRLRQAMRWSSGLRGRHSWRCSSCLDFLDLGPL